MRKTVYTRTVIKDAFFILCVHNTIDKWSTARYARESDDGPRRKTNFGYNLFFSLRSKPRGVPFETGKSVELGRAGPRKAHTVRRKTAQTTCVQNPNVSRGKKAPVQKHERTSKYPIRPFVSTVQYRLRVLCIILCIIADRICGAVTKIDPVRVRRAAHESFAKRFSRRRAA